MELEPHSSQDENAAPDGIYLASSPPPSTASSTRPRKPPPITPRRFTKFFTPRTRTSSASLSKSGRQLRDITRNGRNGANVASRHSTLGKRVLFDGLDVDALANVLETPRSRKRRRGLPTPETSPLAASSPLKGLGAAARPLEDVQEQDDDDTIDFTRRRSLSATPLSEAQWPKPVRRMIQVGSTARLISREFGGASTLGRGRVHDHCADWRSQTSYFYSDPEHRHRFQGPRLPFCISSGHSNDLVAIGEESGGVTILNTTVVASKQASASLAAKSHSNAVMDVAFSGDDTMLATASGDQQCHILDVRTLTPKAALRGHVSSIKQIKFQPGNDNMVATSSRDGSIQLWDLRCRGTDYVIDLPDSSDSESWTSLKVPHLPAYNTILSGHLENEALADRRTDISVTALAFLGAGRDHLLLSGSEASTSIRLWDVRGRYSRRGPATPISCTALPDAHNSHRHYGINSIVVGSDQSRFYALSRDNTVYAYSTSHLILGPAPELSASLKRQPRHSGNGARGLGPLYGFRHPSFRATSFYVKAAIRKATDDQPELLAVGSSDGEPVLFPTSERLLDKPYRPATDVDAGDVSSSRSLDRANTSQRPSLSRTASATAALSLSTIPIYETGTPLVRGHEREATSLAWTRRGELVTLSDDYTCRVWQEGKMARGLRTGGEAEGKRWGCGWAAASPELDEDE